MRAGDVVRRVLTWGPFVGLAVIARLDWAWSAGFSWLADDPCNVAGQCSTHEATTHTETYLLLALPLLLCALVAGLSTAWTRPVRRAPRDTSLLRTAVAAMLGALGALAGGALVMLPALLTGSLVAQLTASALTVLAVARAIEHTVGAAWGTGRGRSAAQVGWLVALAVVAVMVAALAVAGSGLPHPRPDQAWAWLGAAALVPGLVAAAATAAARRRVHLGLPVALGALALGVALVPVVYLTVLFRAFTHEALDTPVAAPPSRASSSATSPPSVSSATPPPGPTEAELRGIRAGRPCATRDLRLSNTDWDAAMGKTFTALVATNRSSTACYLDGVPALRITQGGQDLQLTASVGSSTSIGQPGAPRRVGLAPGASARSTLYWPGYRTAADQHTPQQLHVRAAPGGESAVPLQPDVGPAPFDLVDGGTILVGAWAAE